MRPVLASFLAFLWGAMAQGAFAGQLIVIDSTAPELVPGQVVDGSKVFGVAAGARVTLIAEDGQVTTLKGPFTGRPGAGPGAPGGSGLMGSLSRLVGGPSAVSGALAVMRGSRGADPADAWAVNLVRSVNVCVRAGATPVLRRKKSRMARTLTVKVLPDGAEKSVEWPAGSDRIGWPEGLALTDGGRYLARVSSRKSLAGMSGRTTETTLVAHLVPGGLPSDAHRAAWMADNGCIGQARALLAGLR